MHNKSNRCFCIAIIPERGRKKISVKALSLKHQIFSFENCCLDNIRQVVKAKSLRDISKILGLGKRNSSPSECDWPKVKTQTSCDMAVNRHYLVSFHGEGITVMSPPWYLLCWHNPAPHLPFLALEKWSKNLF